MGPIVYIVVVVITTYVFRIIFNRIEKYFNIKENERWENGIKINPAKTRKYYAACVVNRMVLIGIILSPFYYEYSGWPSSVPVTFTESGKVIKHPYGLFTNPFGAEFSNLPYGGVNDVHVLCDVKIIKDRRGVVSLSYRGSAVIVSPEKFYAQKERRRRYGEDILYYLDTMADSLLYEFTKVLRTDASEFEDRSSEDYFDRRKAMEDSLGVLFDEWIALTGFEEREGVRVTLQGISLSRDYRY